MINFPLTKKVFRHPQELLRQLLLLLYLLALIAVIGETDNTILGAPSANARSTQSEMVIIGLTTLLRHGAELVSRQPPTFRIVVGLISMVSPLLWGPLNVCPTFPSFFIQRCFREQRAPRGRQGIAVPAYQCHLPPNARHWWAECRDTTHASRPGH